GKSWLFANLRLLLQPQIAGRRLARVGGIRRRLGVMKLRADQHGDEICALDHEQRNERGDQHRQRAVLAGHICADDGGDHGDETYREGGKPYHSTTNAYDEIQQDYNNGHRCPFREPRYWLAVKFL